MQGSKNWPVDDLEIFYSFEIPQYYEEGVRYDYGMFQNESSFIYYIDCYYVSPTSEEKYKKILEENSSISLAKPVASPAGKLMAIGLCGSSKLYT